MLAVLGHTDDKGTWREVGKLAAEGFSVVTPISVSEARALPACKHRGDCTTDPEEVRVEQQGLPFLEVTVP
jgi:hypothetical protein